MRQPVRQIPFPDRLPAARQLLRNPRAVTAAMATVVAVVVSLLLTITFGPSRPGGGSGVGWAPPGAQSERGQEPGSRGLAFGTDQSAASGSPPTPGATTAPQDAGPSPTPAPDRDGPPEASATDAGGNRQPAGGGGAAAASDPPPKLTASPAPIAPLRPATPPPSASSSPRPTASAAAVSPTLEPTPAPTTTPSPTPDPTPSPTPDPPDPTPSPTPDPTPSPPIASNCSDGVDNDGDLLIDGFDPGCIVGDSESDL